MGVEASLGDAVAPEDEADFLGAISKDVIGEGSDSQEIRGGR